MKAAPLLRAWQTEALTDYVARQGTVLGRDGRVRVRTATDGGVWIGGTTTTVVQGTVDL